MSLLNTTSESSTEVILLSGFLGSGKTTLLKHMLDYDEDLSRVVVIMNEFGDISVDALIVDRLVNMIELNSGCICCTLQVDLKKQTEYIIEKFNPRWLYIEATGLADPLTLVNIFADYIDENLISSLRIITVIDCEIWQMRNMLGPVFIHQLEWANLILLNKIDKLNTKILTEIAEEISEEFPQAQMEQTTFCQIDHKIVLSNAFEKKRPELNKSILHFHVAESTRGWKSYTFAGLYVLDRKKFNEFLKDFQNEIFRIKGVVLFADQTMILNHVNSYSEWIDASSEDETKLILIGRGMDTKRIAQALSFCIVS